MTHQPPVLTVAIPTYNRREYLRECLESLKHQTFKDFEVIIFDNASDYDVHAFVTQFPKLAIRIDNNETNIGGIANIVKIINHTFTTPYVMMFHDDDTIHPRYFEVALAFLDAHPKAAWVGSKIRFMHPQQVHAMMSFDVCKEVRPVIEVGEQELLNKIMGGFSLGFGSAVYRTDIFKQGNYRSGEFDKWLDRPFMIDLARGRTVGIASFPFVNYRIHPGQDSQIVEPEKLRYVVNLFRYYRSKNIMRDTWSYKNKETAMAMNTAFHVATTWRQFFAVLQAMKEADLFHVVHIRLRGMYYMFKFLFKYLKLHIR